MAESTTFVTVAEDLSATDKAALALADVFRAL